MTIPSTASPSSLLERFRNFRTGDIHNIAAKIHLITGIEACKNNMLVNAIWNKDRSALVVSYINDVKTTLIADGWRLVTTCSCREWQPARNCPHVVIAWATLKRVVSPETFSHIHFNRHMLLDMQQFLDREPDTAQSSESRGTLSVSSPVRQPELEASKPLNPYRLLIEKSRHGNFIRGAIKRGEESVYSWTALGLPTDLARFLLSHYSYVSTKRYFDSFIQITGGAYPIVFRDGEGIETTLAYESSRKCAAGICFDIRGEDVHISRCHADGTALTDNAVVHGQLLFNVATGGVTPVSNPAAWEKWENIFEDLDDGCDPEYGDELDGAGWDDEEIPVPSSVTGRLNRLPHCVVAPRDLFNHTAIRIAPAIDNDQDIPCHFRFNGISQTEQTFHKPTYLLDIPHDLTASRTSLIPLGHFDALSFPFYEDAFRLFNPDQRDELSTPMKTKKRVRAVIETAFALFNETRTTTRNSIIRSMSASPDFLKRAVKREAKQLLTSMCDAWDQSLVIPMATPDGWLLLEDNHRIQAGMIRILFELFGLDAFCCGTRGCEINVATDRLLRELPHLTVRLQAEGFSLRIGSEPLTSASWEFSLDATRSNRDWFELKPEIRCNGEILTEEELQALMDGSGLLRRDGKLMLLDDISAQILAMFSGAMPSARKKRKGDQDLVRVPRLQILDWLNLRSHGVEVRLSEPDAVILESLLNFSSIPPRPVPAGLNATLRHYQVDAWYWLAFLYEHRFGACLADDMGLGKTLQGITLLAGIMSGALPSAAAPNTPHLVVAPPSLLFNWEAELARFLPHARVMLYSGSKRSTDEFATHDIIITSYGVVQRDADLMAELSFDVIIFDETQVVKNLQAATSNAVRKLKGAFTLALTGTPVENHLGEYYAIMDLCLPGLLGTREEFTRTLGRDGAAGTARLIGRTRPFVLRRTKQLIADELPPKIEMDIPLELTVRQRVFYQRTVEEVRSKVKEAYEGHAPAQARIIALTAILRLRQICLAPALAAPGSSIVSPKLDFLTEQLAELRDEGHSALVFSQFTSYLDLIEKGLQERGFSCLRLDGSTPVPSRKRLVQRFQDSTEPTVFLISLKAGGKGLNLTRATYVYHMDPWWNPAVENQASDRAHRIGQTEQVTITRLIMRHTIEEKMMALKAQKLQLYKSILEDGAADGGAGLSREDFEFLLG
jgi:non-specific serine/threonine protein kinase